MRALVLVAVALAARGAPANAAVPTPDSVLTGFNVPSRNIVCNAGPSRGHNVVDCTVFSEARRSRVWHGIRCTSRRLGLTCKNQSGHGFVLSRHSQRVF